MTVTLPLLVLCSSTPYQDPAKFFTTTTSAGTETSSGTWTEEMKRADIFTNFNDIIATVPKLARKGKVQVIPNALHDVFLSQIETRLTAYTYVWEFCEEVLTLGATQQWAELSSLSS